MHPDSDLSDSATAAADVLVVPATCCMSCAAVHVMVAEIYDLFKAIQASPMAKMMMPPGIPGLVK